MNLFESLGLSQPLLHAIKELGFETPSPIQEKAIPQLINGNRDFIGLAQTGTGKTAAFGLPLLQNLDPEAPHTQALILAPTRELGQQIAKQMGLFSKQMPQINTLAVYGGAPISGQIKALKRPQQVIIATPGRLLDLIKRKAVRLNELDFVVLDEADEMLNMGFKEDLDAILSYTPEEKLIWLFSATMSNDIMRIVRTYMDDPYEVRMGGKNEVNTDIEHQYAIIRQSDRSEAITRFLDVDPEMRGVIFCRTRRDTQELAEKLAAQNYRADALHGDMNQRQRDRVMRLFRDNELQMLVATDVAARGIDVNDLTHVFHFNLPDEMAYYTHRSGRTGRAGKKGTSIVFINGREQNKIKSLTKKLDILFEKVDVPQASDVYAQRAESWARDILDTPITGKLDPAVLEKVQLLFGNLSKEELAAKVLLHELNKLSVESTRDLNRDFEKNGGGKYKGKKDHARNHYRSRRGPARDKGGKKKFKSSKKRY